ncbi:DNA translocase FtsK [Coleofasciculus sp. E2-BRE-01]|uniref:DNA translocase FtsK n=1 Tax=Coleofasciculus sp. E2-BRE-01 TaxID=3069524 RepID=UPI0032FF7A5A
MYLTTPNEIRKIIPQLATYSILWLDTEVADWHTPNPRLSLIQILADPTDRTGDRAYILDVLDNPYLVKDFVAQIMVNPDIEKVFHNASFDLRFLGGSQQAQNITCTFKLVRKLTRNSRQNPLQVSNKQLKTLAVELCHFTNVDKTEQNSDWGQRPLTAKQLHYAKMDTVYLAHVHHHLLQLTQPPTPPPVVMTPKRQTKTAEHPPFSATKVRVAFECPRLFYLKQHFDGNTLFTPPGQSIGIGTAFHTLAQQFIKLAQENHHFSDLLEPSADQLNREAVTMGMQQLFYQQVFFPYIESHSEMATVLPKLWQGLTALIQRWVELLVVNRRYCLHQTVINQTFILEEHKLSYRFPIPNGRTQEVTGRFDSLVFNFERNRLCLIDYKTYEPVDPSAQLAQVALYGYMLNKTKGVLVDSAVYCVLPEFKEYAYSWEQLETAVHELIPHKLQQMQDWVSWQQTHSNPPPLTSNTHLCDICPQQETCQTYFEVRSTDTQPRKGEDEGTSDGAEASTTKADGAKALTTNDDGAKALTTNSDGAEALTTNSDGAKALTTNSDAIAQQLVETLQSFNIDVTCVGTAVGPAFIRVKLRPSLGVTVNRLLRLSADLQVQLGITHPPLIAPQPGYVSVDLPRPDRQVAQLEDYITPQTTPTQALVKIAIGVDLDGKLVEADLSDANTCHFLVGGTTGSGKSEFLRSLLLSLLYRHSPQQLKIALVDPKRVTFPEFEQIPWLYSPIVKDSEDAIALMENLVAEMERRYQRFEQAGCSHLDAYNQQNNPPLPRLVCIFDEYADFMTEKDIRNALELSIKRLGSMARAAGIHLIIATQRPEARVVTPIIRSNLPGRVALRTASEADSEIILGGRQSEAAYLLGKGDLLYKVGAKLQRLQSLFAQKIEF